MGYFPGSFNWAPGSTWWINYTAASYMAIDYNADPDPVPRYIQFRGSYADFLVWLTSPIGADFDEEYPWAWRDYTVVNWTDSDNSTLVNPSDYLEFFEHLIGENRTYHVEGIGVDLYTSRKLWICEDDPEDPFFGVAPIVQIAGFPHPERDYCPWHNKEWSVPIPHVVEDATYTAPRVPRPPDANFTYEPTDIFVFDTVTFNASKTETTRIIRVVTTVLSPFLFFRGFLIFFPGQRVVSLKDKMVCVYLCTTRGSLRFRNK